MLQRGQADEYRTISSAKLVLAAPSALNSSLSCQLVAAGTPRAARPGPAPGRLSPSGGAYQPTHVEAFARTGARTGTCTYMTCSHRPKDTQQHRHLSPTNDPLFCSLPYRPRLQPASAEQRMASAASKAWIELGACGPDNPAVKASGAALLVSLLSADGIT